MNIKHEKINGVVICTLNGEVNINTSSELRKAFDAILKENLKKVLIDFSSVSYIDSSGLATLIEMLQRLKKVDGSLRLSNLSEKVRNVFEITKLFKLFGIFDTREQALANF